MPSFSTFPDNHVRHSIISLNDWPSEISPFAGALNPVGPLLILISAAAASFGGNSGLAWMWNLLYGPRIPSSEFQMPEIERSRGWIIAAVVLAIGFIMGLGPGVKFHPV